MTKDEFKPLIVKLKWAYIKDKMFEEEGQINEWYSELLDLEQPTALKAVSNYIRTSRFQPTISDIRDEYNKLMEFKRAKTAEIWEIIDQQLSYWPNADKGKATKDLLAEILNKNSGSWDDKIRCAREIAWKIRSRVEHCEKAGEKLEPDIKDYLRTLL